MEEELQGILYSRDDSELTLHRVLTVIGVLGRYTIDCYPSIESIPFVEMIC